MTVLIIYTYVNSISKITQAIYLQDYEPAFISTLPPPHTETVKYTETHWDLETDYSFKKIAPCLIRDLSS